MFSFLKPAEKFVPLNAEQRRFFEQNLLWLNQEFPEPKFEDRKILLPNSTDFPIKWNQSQDNVFEALKIICGNMDIDPNEIRIDFYDNGMKEIDMGNNVLFMEPDPEIPEAGGLYIPEKVDGKHQIGIANNVLDDPEGIVAIVAHELSHIKLLGEGKMEEVDEMITDFTTVFFGLGIFNANSAFKFFKQHDRWGYNNTGYLTPDEWAYALALYAFARNEDQPEWKEHLNPSIKSDFEKSLQYMIDNENEIFDFDDEN